MELGLENFPFPILFWDDKGQCLPANPSAANWLTLDIPTVFTQGPAQKRVSPGFQNSPGAHQFLWTPLSENSAYATPILLNLKAGEEKQPLAIFDANHVLISFNDAWLAFMNLHFQCSPHIGDKIPLGKGGLWDELASMINKLPAEDVGSLLTWNNQTYLHHLWPKTWIDGEYIGFVWMASPIAMSINTPLWFSLVQRISQNMPDPLIFIDLNKEIRSQNNAFKKLNQRISYENIFSQPERQQALAQALAGNESIIETELLIGESGVVWFSLYLRPILDDFERIIGAIACFHEITDLKKMHKIISQAKEEAESLHRAKTNFISCVSHEIRTPLTAVLNLAEVLSINAQGLEQIELVLLLKESAELMMRQINAVLDYSRLERGKIELHPGPVMFRAVIERIARMFKSQAINRGLVFSVDYDTTLPDLLILDENAIEQILTNLVGNALKFTKDGSIQMRVRSEDRGDSKCSLVVSIADTGAGVDPVFGQQIFALFFQGDSSWKRQHEGIGLGLAIASKLSELMHGCLWYEDNKPHGAIFNFKFEAGIVK